MDARLCTEQWQSTILKQSRLLKQTNEQIADTVNVNHITGPNKQHYKRQVDILRKRKGAVTEQIKSDLQRCSSELLAPLLSKIHASLPLELREGIYEHIFDTSKSILVPRTEHSTHAVTGAKDQNDNAEANQKPRPKYEDLNPFSQDYYYSATVMGPRTNTEIQNLVLRKTPFYFRGSQNAPFVRDLLDTEIRPGVYFRHLVRHLRVHLRCELFKQEAKYFAPGVGTTTTERGSLFEALDEPSPYAMYRARLEGLETLNYADHTVMLELCIFAAEGMPQQASMKRSLYEMVERVYRHARNGGADVTVRYEEFSTGAGEDWTAHLDMSGRKSVQSKQPYLALDHTSSESSPTSSYNALFNAPIPTSETNISWKHGLFDGNYLKCHCEPCNEYKARICPSCGGSHAFVSLSQKEDDGNNNTSLIQRRRPRRRLRNEQRAAATVEQGQASGS